MVQNNPKSQQFLAARSAQNRPDRSPVRREADFVCLGEPGDGQHEADAAGVRAVGLDDVDGLKM